MAFIASISFVRKRIIFMRLVLRRRYYAILILRGESNIPRYFGRYGDKMGDMQHIVRK